jgi:glyoxylase-like metal-dependent hydrolase (beta-lactamase superfamily II)
MSATIIQLPLGPLQTNCYILGCSETNQAAVIDPSWAGDAIARLVEEKGWSLTHILLTHAHFDHVGGLAELKAATGAPIYIHPDAVPMLAAAEQSAARWEIALVPPPAADVMLAGGDTLSVGALQLKVLYTPGHAPGHVCFHLAADRAIFDGDVLFQGSIGRTDLPGGDFDTLMASIRDQLLTLPDETVVLSGHGPATTIGQEKTSNPFL